MFADGLTSAIAMNTASVIEQSSIYLLLLNKFENVTMRNHPEVINVLFSPEDRFYDPTYALVLRKTINTSLF